MVVQRSKERGPYKRNRKVYGVGINDADYNTRRVTDSIRQKMCPYYSRWVDMLERCYSEKHKKRFPTYIGCTVDEPWLRFMTFRAWMMEQDWQGMHLDKDILIPGNKLYSEKTCVFVPPELNTLLVNNEATRGKWPVGVYFDESRNKFRVHCRMNNRVKFLGRYNTPEEASQVYREVKSTHIYKIANEYPNPRVAAGLKLHAALILKGGSDGNPEE